MQTSKLEGTYLVRRIVECRRIEWQSDRKIGGKAESKTGKMLKYRQAKHGRKQQQQQEQQLQQQQQQQDLAKVSKMVHNLPTNREMIIS